MWLSQYYIIESFYYTFSHAICSLPDAFVNYLHLRLYVDYHVLHLCKCLKRLDVTTRHTKYIGLKTNTMCVIACCFIIIPVNIRFIIMLTTVSYFFYVSVSITSLFYTI